jgi:hypothetical protein
LAVTDGMADKRRRLSPRILRRYDATISGSPYRERLATEFWIVTFID